MRHAGFIGAMGTCLVAGSLVTTSDAIASVIAPGTGIVCTTTITLCDGEVREVTWNCAVGQGQCCVDKEYQNEGQPDQCIQDFSVGCGNVPGGSCSNYK